MSLEHFPGKIKSLCVKFLIKNVNVLSKSECTPFKGIEHGSTLNSKNLNKLSPYKQISISALTCFTN
eukprot:snap_masked-scaffold_69-processed-gene-0.11-mRNA-1 protein AED:1.00 eAED:1.00 QI:0/0/0/0/1/1/2/0/66